LAGGVSTPHSKPDIRLGRKFHLQAFYLTVSKVLYSKVMGISCPPSAARRVPCHEPMAQLSSSEEVVGDLWQAARSMRTSAELAMVCFTAKMVAH
jgi:hypothetical protein